MQVAAGKRLRLRAFVEGVEIPVIAATIQATPNSPAIANIQIPPFPEGTRLLPRSLVHLYFLDFAEVDSPLLKNTFDALEKVNSGKVQPSALEKSILAKNAPSAINSDGSYSQDFVDSGQWAADWANERFKLLFCGEIVGFQWSKNPQTRSLILQCADLSTYWDTAQQWNNTDIFGPGVKALFSGGATNLFTDFLDEPGSAVARIIQTPPAQFPNMKGLLGGIIHLIEAIGGSYFFQKKFAGQNIFYSIAELRLHLSQLICAAVDDPTASKLINAGGYDSMLGRSLGNLGAQCSIRKAINALMPIIFHETYPQPSPAFIPGSGSLPSGQQRKRLKDIPQYATVAKAAEDLASNLGKIRDTLEENTLSDVLIALQGARTSLQKTAALARAKAVPNASPGLTQAIQAVGKAIPLVKKGKPQVAAIRTALNEAVQQLQNVANLDFNATAAGKQIPARLNQQIFRPDVWFTAPPRCNVIFPDQYFLFQYERKFLQEPTRLLLKTNDSFFGEDELFDQFYFAPKALGVKGKANTLDKLLGGDLFDHELMTGILPLFEKMGELNIFAARSGLVQGKTPKVGLPQRSANFLFFKHRFAARPAMIQMRFNPYLAVGFPVLIIDRPADQTAIEGVALTLTQTGKTTRSDRRKLGTHFLGNLNELTHSLDQQQGVTMINLAYARQVDEGTEFLGQVQDTVAVEKPVGTKLVTTTVAAVSPPKVGMGGPNGGRVVDVEDVTSTYPSGSITSAQKLPLWGGPKGKTGQPGVQVAVNVVGLAKDYGQEVVAFAGDPNLVVTFRAYKVTEEATKTKTEQVELPPEEYIRPGWYGDCWHPAEISKVYQQFFRTGAITEATQVSDHTPGAAGNITSNALQTLADGSKTSSQDPKFSAASILTLLEGRSIEEAAYYLVLVYSYVKSQNLSVEDFITHYTWRPIASMVDMFGSQDLELDPQGEKVVSGIEGFHSRAFGPHENLFGLVTSDIEEVLGTKRGSAAAIRLDTRARKRQAVIDYVGGIRLARATLG